MKSRWLLITLLLALPFAFAFFLSEARLGQQRTARRVLVIPPPPAATTAVESPAQESDSDSRVTPKSPASETSATATQASDEQVIVLNHFTIPTKPTLLSGTVAKEDNSLIYDADAKLRLATDVILSSPTGVMVSNEKQTIFVGDMQIEAGKNTITVHEGVLDTTTNQMKATVASIAFTNDKNQLIRMTGENVTLELPTGEKSPAPNTILADSVTVESATTASTTPKP